MNVTQAPPEGEYEREQEQTGWREPRREPSLPEVFRSIAVPQNATFWRRLAAFIGPGYLIAVGYMDPGNWATDICRRLGLCLLPAVGRPDLQFHRHLFAGVSRQIRHRHRA